MAEVTAYANEVEPFVNQSSRRAFTNILRADAALTSSYVVSSYVRVAESETVTLLLKHTWVDSTSISWYVEWSMDGTTWYRSISTSTTAGAITVTANAATWAPGASGNIADTITVQGAYMQVYAKKTGGVGADKLEILVQQMTR